MKSKKGISVETGVWVNREKLRKVFGRVAFVYSILMTFATAVFFWTGNTAIGVLYGLMTLPLYIISYSKIMYNRKEEKELYERLKTKGKAI